MAGGDALSPEPGARRGRLGTQVPGRTGGTAPAGVGCARLKRADSARVEGRALGREQVRGTG